MNTRVDASGETGIAAREFCERPVATAGKALFLPDLVKPPGVAAEARAEDATRNAQPTGDPDVDSVVGGQRTFRFVGRSVQE